MAKTKSSDATRSMVRRIDSKNRVALPPEALAALQARPGDYIAIEVDGKTLRLKRITWTEG